MLKEIKNIETLFNKTYLLYKTIIIVLIVLIIALNISYLTYIFKIKRDNVYIVDKDRNISVGEYAVVSELEEIKAKSFIDMFFQYFFYVGSNPDDIKSNFKKIFKVSDNSIKREYELLKSKKHFSILINNDIIQYFKYDSARIDFNKYPLKGLVYGKIIQKSNQNKFKTKTKKIIIGYQLTENKPNHDFPQGYKLGKYKILKVFEN